MDARAKARTKAHAKGKPAPTQRSAKIKAGSKASTARRSQTVDGLLNKSLAIHLLPQQEAHTLVLTLEEKYGAARAMKRKLAHCADVRKLQKCINGAGRSLLDTVELCCQVTARKVYIARVLEGPDRGIRLACDGLDTDAGCCKSRG